MNPFSSSSRRRLIQSKRETKKFSLRLLIASIIGIFLWITNDYEETQFAPELNFVSQKQEEDTLSLPSSSSSSFDEQQNAKEIKEWRIKTETACQKILLDTDISDIQRMEQKETLEIDAIHQTFSSPIDVHDDITPSRNNHEKYKPCRFAFIDLGTNIGDSIGHFVDNALDACSPLWSKKYPRTRYDEKFPHPHLDVTELKIYNKGFKANPLFGVLQKHMKMDPPMLPEETCVYGMEGNPEFTKRLTKLEDYIMAMKPRPIKHLHIHTESVVTEADGPTKLYLDKTSVNDNFWGSSVMSSQQDAVKTAKEMNNGTAIAADVDGIRLTTLVKNTMLPFQPDATDQDKAGGVLIVKMDVEGAEYLVIKELAESNVLCDYISMGNKVVMIVEMHVNSITSREERQRLHHNFRPAQDKLKGCGVQFGRLNPNWA